MIEPSSTAPPRPRPPISFPPGVPLIVLASIAVATSSPFSRLARPADPLVVAFGRVALAAVILSAASILSLPKTIARLSIRDGLKTGLAGVLLALHFACWQWGLDHTSLPAAVSLVSIEPLAVVIAAWFFFRIVPTVRERVGLVVAVGGAIVVARASGQGEHRIIGDVVVLVAVVLFALYVALARGLRDALPARHYAPAVYAAAAIALALMLPFIPTPDTGTLVPPTRSCIFIALLAIVPTGLGHTLIQIASRKLSPSLVALVPPGETLGSILLGAALVGTRRRHARGRTRSGDDARRARCARLRRHLGRLGRRRRRLLRQAPLHDRNAATR
jgi:drug/metabolite transporter (DMT)-like permease